MSEIPKISFEFFNRNSASVAEHVLADLIPDEEIRRNNCTLLADTIVQAHSLNPQAWSLTLNENFITLNLTSYYVFRIVRNGTKVPVMAENIDDGAVKAIDALIRAEDSFKSVKGVLSYKIPHESFQSTMKVLKPGHDAFIEKIARSSRVCSFRSTHSPGLLDYLDEWLGRKLPRPDAPAGSAGKDLDFESLIREFETSYMPTPECKRAWELYAEGRSTARANLAKIEEADRRGEDITDLVLNGLLPYADSPNNRARGCWISVAPAINGDVKKWFNSSGWITEDEWPQSARAICDLITACISNPDSAAEAIARFIELPEVRGFQTGMITPILNALDPDHFLIINSKSRWVLNRLLGEKFSLKLADYTELNKKGFVGIDELEPFLEPICPEGVRKEDVFDHFCHFLVAVKDVRQRKQKEEYWKIAPGRNGELWDAFLKGGYASVGWPKLGDVSGLSQADIQQSQAEIQVDDNRYTKKAAYMVYLLSKIKQGTILVANDGTRGVLGIGRVTAPYYYEAGQADPHRLSVDWFDTSRRKLSRPRWRRTVIRLYEEDYKAIMAAPVLDGGEKPKAKGSAETAPLYTVDSFSSETGFTSSQIRNWLQILKRKQQIILQGPPGTGKTFVAERLARHIVSETTGFWEAVQFHPAYSYEDFIQGIHPTLENGHLTYRLQEGRFLNFCRRAKLAGTNPCVLIIDEINRANLARVFGELMYLLEYRDQSIPLAAGGVAFQVPDNVFIIGTMNTADRSIARMDHAMRRRFSFVRLDPDYEVLKKKLKSVDLHPDGLVDLLKLVNSAIDDPNYWLGISYFVKSGEKLPLHLKDIWTGEIEPYLEEYFFDEVQKVAGFRWAEVSVTHLKDLL